VTQGDNSISRQLKNEALSTVQKALLVDACVY